MASHYTYLLMVREPVATELIANDLPWLYVGVRSCDGNPHDDSYMGSSQYVNAARKLGLEFDKEIIGVHPTRTHANQDEINALRRFKADGVWNYLFNRVIPGEFGKIDYANRVRVIVDGVAKRQSFTVSEPRANRRGGPSLGYRQTQDHVANVSQAITSHWSRIKAFCDAHGIDQPGKGACNVDRDLFRSWVASQELASSAVQPDESGESTANTPGHITAIAEPTSIPLRTQQ